MPEKKVPLFKRLPGGRGMNSPRTEAVKRFIDTGISKPRVVKTAASQTRKVEKKANMLPQWKEAAADKRGVTVGLIDQLIGPMED